MRVDDDVARQANKDTESDKDEVELILDRSGNYPFRCYCELYVDRYVDKTEEYF